MGPEITPRRGLGGSQERPGGLCEPSWPSSPLLKLSYSQLGPYWSPLGAIMGLLGTLLGRSWALMALKEPFWDPFEALFGPSTAVLGTSWALLGPRGRKNEESWKS